MAFFITLITGTPGAGKTLWTVGELVKLYFPKLSIFKSLLNIIKGVKPEPVTRKLYVHGIPGLDIGVPYTQIYCRSPLCEICAAHVPVYANIPVPEQLFNINGEWVNHAEVESAILYNSTILKDYYVEDWELWAEKGALIVVDEVQRVWRPRSSSAAVPSDIAALETHRHHGIDFWIISQSPKLFDTNIRRLVNRHIHLVASWKGRIQYEWPECKESTSGSKADAVSRPYVLKKSVF